MSAGASGGQRTTSSARPSRVSSLIGPVAAAILLAAASVVAGCGESEAVALPEPDIRVGGLVGSFDPSERFYVAECRRSEATVEVDSPLPVAVADHPARAGEYSVQVPVEPKHDFKIKIADEGEEFGYVVRCLPPDFPQWSYEGIRTPPEGLFTVTVLGSRLRSWAIVFDQMGIPRWWYPTGSNVLGAQVLHDGTVAWSRSFGDGYGIDPRMAHEVHSLDGRLIRLIRTVGSITDAHEFFPLPGGHVFINTYKPEGPVDLTLFDLPGQQGPPNGYAVYGEAQELDEEGKLVWRWNSGDHIALGAVPVRWQDSIVSNPKPSPNGAGSYDVFHLNSIEPWGDQVIISSRHTDAIYGIDKASGETRWKLGGTPTPLSLEIVGDPAGPKPFGGQHDVRMSENGILSVFDNSKDRPRPPRLVRYAIDLEARTATYLSELTDPAVPISHCCGSGRATGDDGWLVYWGDTQTVTQFDDEGRIAFRLLLRGPSFRAIPVPEGAVTVAELNRALEAQE